MDLLKATLQMVKMNDNKSLFYFHDIFELWYFWLLLRNLSMSGQSTLASLIQRLEAATTRLEEISTTSVNAPPKRSSSSTALPAGKGIACIEAFSLLMSGPLKEFLDLSVSIGDQVQEQV